MSSKITLGAVFALLVGVGVWNALRPGLAESEAPAVAGERMARIPKVIGLWVGSDTEVNRKAMKVAEAEAYFCRNYVNAGTSDSYSVMLLYGSPGDLGAHDPKTCYAGTGFEQCGSSAKVSTANAAELWTARFERGAPTKSALEVFWAWGNRGDWQAADQPRLAFAGESRIFKLYVQRSLSTKAGSREPESADVFLDPFLQAVKKELAGSGR